MTRSRKMSHLSKISISIFWHHFLKTLKCFILMQTLLQLDIWLQSYEGFDYAKNNMKQRNLNTVYANILKTTSPTSDSFLLIMSQVWCNMHVQIHFVSGHVRTMPYLSIPIWGLMTSFHYTEYAKLYIFVKAHCISGFQCRHCPNAKTFGQQQLDALSCILFRSPTILPSPEKKWKAFWVVKLYPRKMIDSVSSLVHSYGLSNTSWMSWLKAFSPLNCNN